MPAATEPRNDRSPGGVQSVDRAIVILEILARDGEAGVSDVAIEIGVHKSTASRLLSALEARGLVEQSHDRGRYQLGVGVLRIAQSVPGQLDLIRQARPVMAELIESLNEAVNLAVARSHYVVNVDQVAALDRAVTAHNWIGALTPLHATSSGKVLLAAADPTTCHAWLAEAGLKRYTAHTIIHAKALDDELVQVAANGYATSLNEYEEGLNAIAVPVRDRTGAVVAALSAAGPDYRFDVDAVRRAAPVMMDAGSRLSAQLGYLGS